jgi:hypothetical protein
MGDKSPKAKEKARKQDTADKKSKQDAAAARAAASARVVPKKGK